MNEKTFLSNSDLYVFTFGKPPSAIDIMVAVKGLDFETSYINAVYFEEDGLTIRTIFLDDLISAKKASGRAKDINDLGNLIP